jgi:hypothetical protein
MSRSVRDPARREARPELLRDLEGILSHRAL